MIKTEVSLSSMLKEYCSSDLYGISTGLNVPQGLSTGKTRVKLVRFYNRLGQLIWRRLSHYHYFKVIHYCLVRGILCIGKSPPFRVYEKTSPIRVYGHHRGVSPSQDLPLLARGVLITWSPICLTGGTTPDGRGGHRYY